MKRALTEAAAAATAAAAAAGAGAAYGARDMGSRCARANPVKKWPKMSISLVSNTSANTELILQLSSYLHSSPSSSFL